MFPKQSFCISRYTKSFLYMYSVSELFLLRIYNKNNKSMHANESQRRKLVTDKTINFKEYNYVEQIHISQILTV